MCKHTVEHKYFINWDKKMDFKENYKCGEEGGGRGVAKAIKEKYFLKIFSITFLILL